ncbi:MAG: hypothetical protein ACSLE1_21720 [Sphingobium sp.]
MTDSLELLVAQELSLPADPRAIAMAAALAAQYPSASRAVLFYGSCLREANLDGLMLDFYLIVSDYAAAYGKSWLAQANRLIPPNVFPFEHDGLISKYAVLSQADFHRLCSPKADNVSVWARFAQPARLLWAADEAARRGAVAAVSCAAPTLFKLTLPMLSGDQPVEPIDIWKAGFSLTYNAELRAEKTGRSMSIVDSDPGRYAQFGAATLAQIAMQSDVLSKSEAPLASSAVDAAIRWRKLQKRGKRLSVARLAKASFTFAGGIDYLAWKINRHAGTRIMIKPWQRRWPLLGAVTLLPALFRKGAIR